MPGPFVGPGRRRGRSAPPPPAAWSLDALGHELGTYVTATRAPAGVASAPSLGFGMNAQQTNAAMRPALNAGAMVFDGVNDFLAFPQTNIAATLSPTASIGLPAGSGGAPGKGFTCTGLARGPGGTWWLGNDGRTRQGDGSPYLSSIVKLSADFSTKLAEITTASLGLPAASVQGVAVLPAQGQVAFALLGASRRVHLVDEATGALVGAAFGGAAAPGLNGLAYDPDLDALILLIDTAGAFTAVWHPRAAPDLSTPLRSLALAGADLDQIHYDAGRRWLWYTAGANGGPCTVTARTTTTPPSTPILVLGVAGADAIEGLALDGDDLVIANDGYYHAQPSDQNAILRTPLPPGLAPRGPQVPRAATRLLAWGLWRQTAVDPVSRMAFSIGDPVSGGLATGHVGLLHAANDATRLRAYANNAFVEWSGLPAMTVERLVSLEIDLAAGVAGEAELWIDGVGYGRMAFAVNAARTVPALAPCLGANAAGASRWLNGRVRAFGLAYGQAVAERLRIEGFTAHDLGAADRLPAGHPYRNAPP
jgi:hypothetical protein